MHMRFLCIMIACLMVMSCNSQGKKSENGKPATKPLFEMTIEERCDYYLSSMVKAAEADDAERFDNLDSEFNTWAESLSEDDQYVLMKALSKWKGDNFDAFMSVIEWDENRYSYEEPYLIDNSIPEEVEEVIITDSVETPLPMQEPEIATQPDVMDNEEEAIPSQLVEEKPSFQGGDANQFSKWVNQRLVYPDDAKEKGIQGRVTLQFTVEKDGTVTNVKVLRGLDPSLDKEAVRVVSMSPKWKPGKQRDRAVPVIYTFPVFFN